MYVNYNITGRSYITLNFWVVSAAQGQECCFIMYCIVIWCRLYHQKNFGVRCISLIIEHKIYHRFPIVVDIINVTLKTFKKSVRLRCKAFSSISCFLDWSCCQFEAVYCNRAAQFGIEFRVCSFHKLWLYCCYLLWQFINSNCINDDSKGLVKAYFSKYILWPAR